MTTDDAATVVALRRHNRSRGDGRAQPQSRRCTDTAPGTEISRHIFSSGGAPALRNSARYVVIHASAVPEQQRGYHVRCTAARSNSIATRHSIVQCWRSSGSRKQIVRVTLRMYELNCEYFHMGIFTIILKHGCSNFSVGGS